MADMASKTVLITGANSGIGKVAARELARMGATVVIVCRDKVKAEAALREVRPLSGNGHVEWILADLSSQAAIRALTRDFMAKYTRLDVLLNNAGLYAPRRVLTVDGIETTFAVNHLAYFLLTHLLLGVLKQSVPSRIINVASGAHQGGRIEFDNLQEERRYSGVMAYSNSKLIIRATQAHAHVRQFAAQRGNLCGKRAGLLWRQAVSRKNLGLAIAA